MKDLKGIYAALITPYKKNGSINYDAAKDIIDYELGQGIDGFYVGGSTGEAFLLSSNERKKFLESAIEANNGRGKIIAHVGSIGTKLTIELGKHAKAAGADTISAVTPFYYKFTSEQIINYYNQVADAVDMPLVVYNFPNLTGYALSIDDVAKLSKNPNIVGIKYTSLDLYTLERFKYLFPDMVIFNGRDESLLYGLVAGADGGIGSTYNFMPDKYRKLVDLFKAGKIEEAQKIQHQVNAVIPYLGKYGDIVVAKEFLRLRGIDCGDCRGPFSPLTAEGRDDLKKAFDAYIK